MDRQIFFYGFSCVPCPVEGMVGGERCSVIFQKGNKDKTTTTIKTLCFKRGQFHGKRSVVGWSYQERPQGGGEEAGCIWSPERLFKSSWVAGWRVLGPES